MTTTTTNRRALLRLAAYAGGATVVANAAGMGEAVTSAHGAVPIETTAWDKATAKLAALLPESCASDRAYDAVWAEWDAAGRPTTGALHNRLTASIARSNAFGDKIADAQTDLMLMPAPHGDALLWKLDHIMEDCGDGSCAGWSLSYTEQMMADARRLLRREA